jgi:hypothetical protein
VALKVQMVIIQYLVVLQLLSVVERVLLEAALLAVLVAARGFREMPGVQEPQGKGMLAGLEVVEQPLRVAEVLVLPV